MPRARIITDSDGRFYRVRINCPGCRETHELSIRPIPAGYVESPYSECSGAHWIWNGSVDNPTFAPSLLVRTGHYCNAGEKPGNCACDFLERFPDEDPWEHPCKRCHSFVREGRIQFLTDCSHALAGQTVDLPEIDDA